MIDIEQQQNLFIRIAEKLPKKIEVYAIGGTAMMFLGLKDQTIDVDLVFSNPKDRKTFKEAAKLQGFTELSAKIIYGEKDNVPEVVSLLDVRLDLFLFKIITSHFSPDMQQRATQTHEFSSNLIIKVADPSDILIMKSVTSREKDLEDIVSIINNSRINWDLIIKESAEQVKQGNETVIMNLGLKLEKLSNQELIKVPKSVLGSLWALLKEQVKDKNKKKK